MNTRKTFVVALSVLLTSLVGLAQAQESGVVTIEGTTIRGDQEVPTVMYLVPWQPPEVEDLKAPDERLMVAQEFSPLERYEFQRLMGYYQAFSRQQADTSK
ncbi:hypothetical protein BKP64_03710 [Marinobacter salinus]|uniref:Uncharacterized protein n=2 Tax=Marinobacter salinus TaxID=1874317 RepID=A0A1D9GRF3_9GAMM|nr:hypothetical protein BKP64_03710 [Marinobacter salinus]